MYYAIMFVVVGILGTLVALRLMAIDAQERPTKLTVRGRLVVGLIIGMSVATFVFLINGVWWNCDLTDSESICKVTWGY
jgi:hypothetical protein